MFDETYRMNASAADDDRDFTDDMDDDDNEDRTFNDEEDDEEEEVTMTSDDDEDDESLESKHAEEASIFALPPSPVTAYEPPTKESELPVPQSRNPHLRNRYPQKKRPPKKL